MESLLFVVESMTTVGYGWLLPFSSDVTMLLAIQIMLSGVIMIFIVVPLLIAPFLTTLLAPTPPRRTPHTLTGHTVIMGYDELTRAIVDSLGISDHDVLIVEQDKDYSPRNRNAVPAPGIRDLGRLQRSGNVGCSAYRESRLYRYL